MKIRRAGHAEVFDRDRKSRRKLLRLFPGSSGLCIDGKTKDQAAMNIREAIALHIQGLKEDGIPI